jgi:hypothetical protein
MNAEDAEAPPRTQRNRIALLRGLRATSAPSAFSDAEENASPFDDEGAW